MRRVHFLFLLGIVMVLRSEGLQHSLSQLPSAQARAVIGSASLGSKLYFAGGNRCNGQFVDLVDVFDFASGAWQQVRALSSPRSNVAGAASCGFVLFGGGAEQPSTRPSNAVDYFNGT